MNNNPSLLPRLAIWLVPRQPERGILQALIADLADRFSAPGFVPHATVYSCRRSPLQNELAITAALARHCPALTLCTAGTASRDRLTRACFVRLGSNTTLRWLRQSLQNKLPPTAADDFEPHVSLLYQNLPETDRAKLAKEIWLPFDEICFDQIWAVAIPETIKGPENLTGWQTLLSCRLDSSVTTDKIQLSGYTKKPGQRSDHERQDRNRPR